MPAPLTVLIVNDHEDNANIWWPRDFRKVDPNLTIISATDAVTAMDMIAEHRPDILLCDVCIPHSESDHGVPNDGKYIHSLKVVEAFDKMNPEGAIILDSTYAKGYKDFYPEKAILLGHAIGDSEIAKKLETLREIVDTQKQRKVDSALPGHAIGDSEIAEVLEPIREAVEAHKERKDDSAPLPPGETHGKNPRLKEPSRILQVRRSDWHNGSRAANEESWSIKTSPLSTGSPPKRER